jgi:hypothetical protein
VSCAFSRSRALAWQSMRTFARTAICCWINTAMAKPARCAVMKHARMDSIVTLGASSIVNVDGAITQRSLSIRFGRESPVEAALGPEHGLKLVDASNLHRLPYQTATRTSWRRKNDMAQKARTGHKLSSRDRKPTQRDCLRCERVFHSEGPFNRLCKACLEYLNASPTPMEEYTIGYV